MTDEPTIEPEDEKTPKDPLIGEVLDSTVRRLLMHALQDKPMHGYAALQAVSKMGEGAFRVGAATIYPALYNLERDELIVGEWEIPQNAKPRKVYHLTDKGRNALKQSSLAPIWKRLAVLFGGI